MATDREWMYKPKLPNGKLDPKFVKGVSNFVDLAFSKSEVVTINSGLECISCPCEKCVNLYNRPKHDVRMHLFRWGFCGNYTQWKNHGEPHSSETDRRPATPIPTDNLDRMDEMLRNAAGPNFDWDARENEEAPRGEAQQFFDMLEALEQPLWEININEEMKMTCENHNVLSAVTKCLALKSDHNLSQRCFDGMMKLIKSMLPVANNLPESFYNCKKLVRPLGMEYVTIDCCPQFCMLYHKQNKDKTECDSCHEPRYEPSGHNEKAKPVARAILRYLPLKQRLQRLYMTKSNSKAMRWHKEGLREKPDMMVHPADSPAWKTFDEIHPDFASETRNVRLGLSTDGFNAFNSNATPYSCWPVVVFPYNLPPGLLMKEDKMFLAMVLPGPKHPGRDIDILLEPLIDELQSLWMDGVETYDVLRREYFNMKVSLLWTVSDYPAYEMLSGWGTHGKLACLYCGGNTKAFQLPKGGKASWFDCSRHMLPENHEFRRDKKNFIKGRVVKELAQPIRTGEELLEEVNRLPPIKWGKNVPLKQIPGYGDYHHWQKKSIFWRLPYWATNLIRHNLDMMHVEKNNTENLLFMIFDISGRTKDNKKARQDLEILCNRPLLHLTADGDKPKAPYALNLVEKRQIMKWLKEKVNFPDGYARNWSRCVSLTNCTFTGLKSHDLHVFMERLLPIAFRDFVPDDIWEALCELSGFFREVCAKEIDLNRMAQLEKDIVVTVCKLEKHFPPGYFDSMEHLVLHVAHEARLGGPVAYRWMYPCERLNKFSRRKVTNKARVEASIVEATLIQEISDYCSQYFAEQSSHATQVVEERNNSESKLSIFESFGRCTGRVGRRPLDANEYKAAHNYVLFNCPEIQPYLNEFDNFMLNSGQVTPNQSLDKIRQDKFANWLRKKVLTNRDGDTNIHNLGLMPDSHVVCYNGCIINGFKFYTEAYCKNKTTNNSGICVKGESNDNGAQHDYYGVLQEVVELEYGGNNKVVLFKCIWFDITNGINVDHKHGIIEVKHTSRLRHYEPFALACQPHQVYYLSYPSTKGDRKNWWVVYKTRRRGKLGFDEVGADDEFYQEDRPNCPIDISVGEILNEDDMVLAQDEVNLADPTTLFSSTAIEEEETTSGYDNDEPIEQELHLDEDEEYDDPYALGEDD